MLIFILYCLRLVDEDHNMSLNEKDSIDFQVILPLINDINSTYYLFFMKDESVEEQQLQDEGFQDKGKFKSYKKVTFSFSVQNLDDSLETSEKTYDTEHNLRSLYGSLSSTMKHVHEIYESKSSRLR